MSTSAIKPIKGGRNITARSLTCAASLVFLLIMFCSLPDAILPSSLRVMAADPSVWSLVWDDEFDGPNGSGVDPSKWTMETGGNGWGNNELETYTSSTQNAFLSNGTLVIKA